MCSPSMPSAPPPAPPPPATTDGRTFATGDTAAQQRMRESAAVGNASTVVVGDKLGGSNELQSSKGATILGATS